MINLKNILFEYYPFPHGISNNVIEEDFYKRINLEFPETNELKILENQKGNYKFYKYALSSKNDKEKFNKILSSKKNLRKFVNYLLSYDFKAYLIDILKKNNIEFGIEIKKPTIIRIFKSWLKKIIPNFFTKLEQDIEVAVELSSIPIKGGMIKPHSDSQHKLASIVIPILDDHWKDEYEGGTNFLKVKKNDQSFNFTNKTIEFDQTEIIKTIPFVKNQLLIFIKTYNSLHSVGPLKGKNEKIFRKSLTITVEKKIKI